MKKSLVLGLAGAFATLGVASSASAAVLFFDDFETTWSGDYADGWVNTAYRHGAPPIGQMMQQTTTAYGGSSYGMELSALSVSQSWMWWAGVSVESLDHAALDASYNPYVSVYYYDEGLSNPAAGQVFAVPDWVNLYLEGGTEDWTDVQFGGRYNNPGTFYHVSAGENSPGWDNTDEARTVGWRNLKFQLSAVDNRIHFFIDGAEVGASYRNDYTNLGTEVGLFTMFDPAIGPQNGGSPSTIWDNFEVGSDAVVPIPAAAPLGLLGMGLIGLARKLRKKSA